jgi:hypothetical protein
MPPRFDEIIVQKNLPLCVDDLPMAKRHECGARMNTPCLLCCDVLEVFRQLKMNRQHVAYDCFIKS